MNNNKLQRRFMQTYARFKESGMRNFEGRKYAAFSKEKKLPFLKKKNCLF